MVGPPTIAIFDINSLPVADICDLGLDQFAKKRENEVLDRQCLVSDINSFA